ncbi:MAG: ankyrin repeat domain-containing protein [Thermodesulfobacteriota bacterium]
MPKGRILKIKPGHEANCSSGMVAFAVLMTCGVTLLPLSLITAIVHSLKAGSLAERPLRSRKNIWYWIIPSCLGCVITALMLWLALTSGHSARVPVTEGVVMGAAFIVAVSMTYYLAWRIGRRRLVFVLIPVIPLLWVALSAGLMALTIPGMATSVAMMTGLWDPRPALVAAAMNNDLTRVRKLLQDGHDVNAKGPEGVTALHAAARAGSAELVRVLLEHSADVNARNSDKETALFGAAEDGHVDVLRLLLDAGADVNARDKYGATALFSGSGNARLNAVKIMLRKGADVKVTTPNGRTPLLAACEKSEDVSAPSEYDETKDPSPDSGGREMQRPESGSDDRREIALLLLDRGVDVNGKTSGGWTPLMEASENGYADVVRLLLERGAEVNAKNCACETTALLEASKSGFSDVVRLLVQNGADLNACHECEGLTALGRASAAGHTEAAEALQSAGAKDFGPRFGAAALIAAARRKDSDRVRDLLEQGFPADAQDCEGNTALHEACKKGDLQVIRILLDKGAEVNARTRDGDTVLHTACAYGHVDVVRLLLQHGADVHTRTAYGETALRQTSPAHRSAIIMLLKEHGAKE